MSQELDFSLIKTYYHISPEGAEQPLFELPAAMLAKPEHAIRALEETGKLWRAIGMELPVSFTGITFFNLGLMNLWFGAQSNQFLRLPLSSLTFQLEWHNDHAHCGYKIHELDCIPIPVESEARRAALIEAWTEYIQETAIPAINAIAQAGAVRPDLIWNQFGAGIHSIRATIRKELSNPVLSDRIDADFEVIESLPAEVFKRKRNPYVHKPRYIDNPWSPPDGQYIIRSSCCMYDKRENGSKCYNCPRMLPQDRETLKQQRLAKSK